MWNQQAQKQHLFCGEFAITTGERECLGCKSERRKRQVVSKVATDPCFTNKKLTKAPSVLANNDIKYEVNKLRAQTYAQEQNK